MNVIPFPSWRVFCFLDDEGTNAIVRGMNQAGVTPTDRSCLQLQIYLLEAGGPGTLPGLIVPVVKDFLAFSVKSRKGSTPMNPVFCYGPFGESEITLLTWAPIEGGLLKARDVLPKAERNLAVLKDNRKRRIRERIG